ncbi:MAG: tetratricopeptide repeat protein [Novosphingobium sp.]|uniref:tetratricopeptide repeat-containing sulfotransferase family protein n=1 Tax=Novosphingobium sp. TaxID=1874826 RepID=UPI0018277F20|nr:tetratricopeptide repeat protein [Novosphingobium sp.]
MAGTVGTVGVVAKPLVSQARQQIANGRFEAAAQALIGYLRQAPNDGEALGLLGRSAMMLGALGQAEQFLRRALASGANGLEVYRDLISVLNQQERTGDVLRMIAGMPLQHSDHVLRSIEASVLDKLGRSDEAMAIHAALAAEHPSSPPMHIAYGHDLRAAGRVDDAIAAYRRAIAADAEFGEAWWGLANIKRPVLNDADIAAMHTQLEIAVDVRNAAPLNFALARAYHDRGDYAAAFTHYAEGNRLRAEGLKYDASQLTQEVAETERIAIRALIDAMPGDAVGSGNPIFIVSLPRAGSTLLEQMLGSHPAIEPAGELGYIPAILRTVMEMATRRGKVSVPRAITGLSDEIAQALGNDYLTRAAHHRKTDRPFFIDKLPHNWSNILFIRRILPQARFIDIRRPAMDCCFSNFTQSFTSAHASSFALRDVGQCYVDNVRLMDHFDRVAPGLIHHTAYTDLVEQPREELGRILAYLGLPWDDTVLDFHQLDRVVRTPSSEQVRRPLNRDGIGVWQPYSQWLDPLREVLGDLAEG